MPDVSRRELVIAGSAAVATLTFLDASFRADAFPERPGEELIPWLDQPPENPVPEVVANQLNWEQLDSWITPNDRFFSIAHYNRPVIDAESWKLEIGGLVARPQALALNQIKQRPRQEVVFTLECSGNHGFPWLQGGIGTARWAGTPLAALLEETGILDGGVEVVFYGADAGEEVVRDVRMRQQFARSMSIADAMNPNNLLCYEMNGAPLPPPNGFPLRLICPGWFGVANVKWLTRIELRDKRLMNRFMARDYVTIREEMHGTESVWTETSVGRALLKSVAAKVTRKPIRALHSLDHQFRIVGAAWGGHIQRVDVRIDEGPWQSATIDSGEAAEYAWRIWSLDWENPAPGDHTITTRAIDVAGHVQPPSDDPKITNKRTYWESNGQVTRRIRI